MKAMAHQEGDRALARMIEGLKERVEPRRSPAVSASEVGRAQITTWFIKRRGLPLIKHLPMHEEPERLPVGRDQGSITSH